MTDRIPLDDLTSDQLDTLYQRAEHADAVTAETKRLLTRRTTTLRQRAERAEAALEGVRSLHRRASHGDTCVYCAHGQRLGYDTTWPCDTIRALGEPSPAATAGHPLTEEQADAIRAADLPPGTVITEAVVAEAMQQLGTTAAKAVQRAIGAQQQDFALTSEQVAEPARLLNCGHCYEEKGEEVHPHPECPVEQSGPAATEATEQTTTARVFAGLHRSAEADISRVITLYEQWVKAGPPPLGTSLARWWDARLIELHHAIRPTNDQTKER